MDSTILLLAVMAMTSSLAVTSPAITTTPAPIQAPALPGPVMVRFPTVTVLPNGWAAYPGKSLANGEFITTVDNGDICLQLCAGLTSCKSFDFNAFNGGCWKHDDISNCNPPFATPVVYHVKRTSMLCALDNHGNEYPQPVETNP